MDAFSPLIRALRTRLEIVADDQSRQVPERHLARLRTISEEIDRLSENLPRPLPSQLAHYLQRRSYSKALEFLEQADQPNENTTRQSAAR